MRCSAQGSSHAGGRNDGGHALRLIAYKKEGRRAEKASSKKTRRLRADNGYRTRIPGLEGWCPAIGRCPHIGAIRCRRIAPTVKGEKTHCP